MIVYTIGHSTCSIEQLLAVLKAYKINQVVDVRHFPASRKFPWFNKENLEKSLAEAGIKYFWLEALGGFRKDGYALYSKTEEFAKGLEALKELAALQNTAILCAEILWFKCHRKYIADALTKQGIEVIHIYNEKRAEPHADRKGKIKCDKAKNFVPANSNQQEQLCCRNNKI